MSFRGKDLAEALVEPVAQDNHSLDSGPEGPEEPDKPNDHLHNMCKLWSQLHHQTNDVPFKSASLCLHSTECLIVISMISFVESKLFQS